MKPIKLLSSLLSLLCLFTLKHSWAQMSIMPLGDSITKGSQSTGLNGYRRELRNLLVSSGYVVNFVGSLQDGTFDDKQHEGHSGWTDDQIKTNIDFFLDTNPADIILLHIGTNDISGNPSYTNPADVEDILDNIDLWETQNKRTAIVILAEIINRQAHVCPLASTTTTFNNNVREMAENRINAPVNPDRIVIVDMECSAGLNYNADMADTVHPNDNGYEKMAAKWFADGLLAILPLADAGADQNVDEQTLVTLDGSYSFDPDAAAGIALPLDYSWKQQSGTSVVLSNSTAEKPTFTAPAVASSGERLTFKLTVTDADGFQHSDTVSINVDNVLLPPLADAGPDQTVAPGSTVTLNGSTSYDPDGTFTAVQWEQVSGKNQVSLTTPTELTSTFTAPTVDSNGDVLMFKLTVKDNDDLTSSDTVTITVAIQQAPIADAGPDQTVAPGSTVTLDGSTSYDPDGTFTAVQWEQVSGKNQVSLTTPTELTSTFTAPTVDSNGDVLMFKLTVKDNDDLTSSDTVTITVAIPQAPIADAGPDQTVAPGSTVTLDGSNSYDPNGTIEEVQWEQVAGTWVDLTTPNSLTTNFKAPAAAGELLGFRLAIRGGDKVSEDTVNVRVSATPTTGGVSSNGGSGGGGCFIQTVID